MPTVNARHSITPRSHLDCHCPLLNQLHLYNSSLCSECMGIVRTPLWPISACYQVSVSGTMSFTVVVGLLLVAVYIIGLALVAGKWLECRELLLY